jgi:hypothetical protein
VLSNLFHLAIVLSVLFQGQTTQWPNEKEQTTQWPNEKG